MSQNAENVVDIGSKNPMGLGTAMGLLSQLRVALKGAFLERDQDVDAILAALLAEEHVLLLGPPGTAKSAVTDVLAQALSCSFYEIMLTKHTTPEEPFGPWDLPALKNGEYKRITRGRFPEAQLCFIDEIFKSNSAILNGFLLALNERKFDNGGVRMDIPLQCCIAASNELAQDEALGALFDRFLVRRYTRYISDRDNRKKLLSMTSEPSVTARLPMEALDLLRAARRSVDCSATIDPMLDIGDALLSAGIEVSDRRWRKVVKLVQASAVLRGSTVADTEDLLILGDALWDNPDDHAKIFGIIAKAVSPDMQEALQLLDSATQLWAKAQPEKLDASKPEQLGALAALNRDMKGISERVRKLKQTGAVIECAEKIRKMHQYVGTVVNRAVLGDWSAS